MAGEIDFELPMAEKLLAVRDAMPSGVAAGTSSINRAFPVSKPDLSAPLVPVSQTTMVSDSPGGMLESPLDSGIPDNGLDADALHPFKLLSAAREPIAGDENQSTLGFIVYKEGSSLMDGLNGDNIPIVELGEVLGDSGKVSLKIYYSDEVNPIIESANIVLNDVGADIIMGDHGILEQSILIGYVKPQYQLEGDATSGLIGFSFIQSLTTPLVIKYDFYNGQLIRLAVPGSGHFDSITA